MDFFDLASTAISAGTTIWGTLYSNDANEDAAEDYAEALLEAAGYLNKAEKAALKQMLQGNRDMYDTYRAQRNRGDTDLESLVEDYRAGVIDASDIYNTVLSTAGSEYADHITGAANQYGSRQKAVLNKILGLVGSGSSSSLSALTEGLDGVEDAYGAYLENGEDALAVLAEAMGRDPSQLTASQQALVDDYSDQMRANLAASGLMGSGSAVAAFNEGQADLMANLYDDNQDQIDQAARTLAQYGYGASGNVADARQGTARSKAAQVWDTAKTKASAASSIGGAVNQNLYDTVMDAAKSNLNIADKTYTAKYKALLDAADLQASTAKDRVSRDDVYAGIKAALQGSGASLKAGTLKNIAGNYADALTGGTTATSNAATTNASNTATMYGTLASLAAKGLKSALS